MVLGHVFFLWFKIIHVRITSLDGAQKLWGGSGAPPHLPYTTDYSKTPSQY